MKYLIGKQLLKTVIVKKMPSGDDIHSLNAIKKRVESQFLPAALCFLDIVETVKILLSSFI